MDTLPSISEAREAGAPMRVAVLASGGGSNLQALLDRFNHASGAPARVELVIASRAGIGALARAEAAGVASSTIDPRQTAGNALASAMIGALDGSRIELVVLAGYMHLVPAAVVERFHGRMLNIHPALLPAFGGQGLYGMRVHRAVIESGARVSGATVHLVDERYDTGPIVAQWPVPVLAGDAPEGLAKRVLSVEHRLLPAVVEAFASRSSATSNGPCPDTFALVAGAGPDVENLRSLVRLPVSHST
jgi:phosphoribosylglycinamide formyltransferase 1